MRREFAFSATLSATLAALLCFAACPSAHAWGCKGHQTVALVAEKELTPEANQMVQALLSANPIDPKLSRYCGNAVHDLMADASTWPDDIRGERKNGAWHYIDIPRGAKRGVIAEYCGAEGCVISALAEQTAILKDKNADSAKRADALRYVIHFVGDLHQPLHATTNADEGGNCVPIKYFRRNPHEHGHGYSPNLHALWDTAIPERDMEGADPAEFADALDVEFAPELAKWRGAGIHVEEWAWESHDLAETAVYEPLQPKVAIEPNVPVHSCTDDNNIGARLMQEHLFAGEAYQQQANPVVDSQLAKAGVRLALILNDAERASR